MNSQKLLFGFMPLPLIWGYIAIAIFMAGDGFEMAFLSKYITNMGFSQEQATFVFTVYAFVAAIAAWSSGVIAEVITPQKAMLAGFAIWVVFHVLFMTLGIGMHNYPLMVIFYGLRGFGYPLFIYSFIILLIHNLPQNKISTAMGWFWAAYSVGLGTIGGLLPGYTNSKIGEHGTLWLALIWVAVGGLLALFALRKVKISEEKANLSSSEKIHELTRAITILFTNKYIFMSALIRIINTIPLFGVAIIMPWFLEGDPKHNLAGLGFKNEEWQQIWALFLTITIFTNVLWGIMGDHIGWLRQVRWIGCVCGVFSCLAFYYVPLYFGHNYYAAMIPAVMLGITVAAFVPMTAVFTALEPNHQGAAISIYNLSASLSQSVAAIIAGAVIGIWGISGVLWTYAGLYVFAAILTYFIKVDQPKMVKTVRN
ncbi:Atg22 family (BtlA) (PUBMED:12583894) [Commensalibacter communis]|uniref:MFS transporter n=1 Tax=Commensalibacter communis TaxID=2972786 RepID=UPI0022FF995A|nr:MFS transporter [Commensalibacter communis]CAI3941311.1 Atg22 family (BtlA) (PUBMED:12583894) [Commensalibacter communis]